MYFQSVLRVWEEMTRHAIVPNNAQNMNQRPKGKMFSPDWTQAEQAAEDKSVLRSSVGGSEAGRGCFPTSLGAKTNIILYKKIIEAGTRLLPIQIHHDRVNNKGRDKQLRTETNFSSLGKEEKRSKWNSISQKLKLCACREQKQTRLME